MDKKLMEKLEEKLDEFAKKELKTSDLDTIGKLVDIHTDLANQEYWKKKEEVIDMNYRNYGNDYMDGDYSEGNYSRRGVPGTGRGRRRYSERGRDRRYGEDKINEMYGAYQDYSDGKEEYNMGNYGAKGGAMKSLDYMLKSVVQFIEMLKEDASSQEEIDMIKHYSRKIAEM